jgi:RHS repeat-associated protein
LQFFPIAEGYVNVTIGKYGSSIYNYIYNYTDHLGNIRLSYGKDNTSGLLKIFEENHYYPFGLKHRDYNAVQLIWSRESNEELARIKPSTPVVPPSYKYKFSGKEFQDELGLNMYDFEARGYMPDIGRTTTIDPHAYNYPWASPYNYAFNNPTLVIDPDGKDGIVTGAGTKDDPYRVKANYYYYGLNAKQAKGLNEAISSYNNNGKARSFMDTNGNKTYVVMELMATEVADVDTAREKAFGDSVEIGEESARYGNIVTTGGESSNVHFGEASDLRVTLNQDKITSILADFPGGNEDRFIKGTFIHEIGHNLGASHGDPGSIMRDQSRDPQLNKSQFGGGGSGVYIYGYPSINTDSVRAFMGRVNSPGSINSYYLNTKENDNVKNHKDNGAPGAIRKGN